METLLELLGLVGHALDTPGAYTRGVLAGRPGERISGRELLEAMGLAGENQDGLNFGDVLGFGTEMLLDPINLAGGGLLAKLLGRAGQIKRSNQASEALRAAGAMPEEVARLTRIVDETGMPERMFHGTPHSGVGLQDLSPAHTGTSTDFGFLGKGVYFTDNPQYAASYAGDQGQVLEAFLDVRNPFNLPSSAFQQVDALPAHAERQLGIPIAAQADAAVEAMVRGGQAMSPMQQFDAAMQQGVSLAEQALSRQGYDAAVIGGQFGFPEVAVRQPGQVYAPQIAPALQPAPRGANPLMAALLGHNAAARGLGGGHGGRLS